MIIFKTSTLYEISSPAIPDNFIIPIIIYNLDCHRIGLNSFWSCINQVARKFLKSGNKTRGIGNSLHLFNLENIIVNRISDINYVNPDNSGFFIHISVCFFDSTPGKKNQ